MDFDAIKPARLLITLMKIFGFWNNIGKRLNKFYKFYAFFIHSIFSFLTLIAMLINTCLTTNIDELAEALYIPLPSLVFMVKVINIFILSDRIVDFLDIIEQDRESQPCNKAELKMLKGHQENFIKLRNTYIFSCVAVLFICNVQPLMNDEYILPFPCWIPFDYRNPGKFWYAYSFVAVSMNITALANMTVDLLQAYFLFNLAMYYELIALRMESYGLPESVEELKRIIKFHQFADRMMRKCQDIISIPVFIQIVMSALIICFIIFQLQKTSLHTQTADFISLALFGVVMIMQIYLPCYYGNEVTLSAEGLVNAIYSSNWMDMSVHTRKLIYVYMEYLNHPIQLKAGGFFDIGLDVFAKTINNAYSLYALLLNFQN